MNAPKNRQIGHLYTMLLAAAFACTACVAEPAASQQDESGLATAEFQGSLPEEIPVESPGINDVNNCQLQGFFCRRFPPPRGCVVQNLSCGAQLNQICCDF